MLYFRSQEAQARKAGIVRAPDTAPGDGQGENGEHVRTSLNDCSSPQPAPQQLPCCAYIWSDSVPCGDRFQSVQSFSRPHDFLFKQRKSDRNHKSPARGVRGVWDPPERPRRARPCGAPSGRTHTSPKHSVVSRPRRSKCPGPSAEQQAADRAFFRGVFYLMVPAVSEPPDTRDFAADFAPCLFLPAVGGCRRPPRQQNCFPVGLLWPGRFQPCEKRLVPPSAGNRTHLSKHISTCQGDLYRRQLKKALASAGTLGLPGEIKGTRGVF